MRKRGGGAQKISREQVRERLAFAERALVTLPTVRAVLGAFTAKFKTTVRTAERYISRVRAEWDKESLANPADRERVRAQLDRCARVVFNDALTARKFVAANGALRIRLQLHGLANDTETQSGDVTVVFKTQKE